MTLPTASHIKKIAITGGIGSGKSAFGQMLRSMGYPVVDADEIARYVPSEPSVKKQIIESFGKKAYDKTGLLDRKYLSDIVFQDVALKKKLEDIMHPAIRHHWNTIVQKFNSLCPNLWIFYEVALLIETNIQQDFDAVILVTASAEKKLARLEEFRKISTERAQAIMNFQFSDDIKQNHAHIIIDNTADLKYLENQMLDALIKLKDLFYKINP